LGVVLVAFIGFAVALAYYSTGGAGAGGPKADNPEIRRAGSPA
jgi:hypothetical protein